MSVLPRAGATVPLAQALPVEVDRSESSRLFVLLRSNAWNQTIISSGNRGQCTDDAKRLGSLGGRHVSSSVESRAVPSVRHNGTKTGRRAMKIRDIGRAYALLLAVCLALPAEAEERFFATSWDMRTVLLFHVSDQAIQKSLPDGWEVIQGKDGVNLQLVFAENIFVQNADGQKDDNVRVITWVVPAKKKNSDDKGAMVVGGFISLASKSPGPYGVWAPAATTLVRKTSVDANGKLLVDEDWSFASPSGNTADLQIEFARSKLARGKVESKVFSAANPDFFRIYRIEQASELIPTSGDERLRRLSFKAKGPKFEQIFDGAETLVGVVSVPWFARQIYLPGS
jgi:hypothetical protein